MSTSQTTSQHIPSASQPSKSSYLYPFAAGPDIIRSNQKDTYFQGVLLEQLSTIVRRLYGSRVAHSYSEEARTFTELLYLGLTTFIGNRTLGEEYCDVYQIEGQTQKLPALRRRTGYILCAVLLPYGLTKILPSLRSRIRQKLEASLTHTPKASSWHRVQSYVLVHLSTITSSSPVYALTLSIFYFTGSYYHLSKRLFGLRYIFSKRLAPSEQRVGYEVLGVLLVLQMVVQAYIHMHSTLSTSLLTEISTTTLENDVDVGLGQGQNADGKGLDPAISADSVDSRARIGLNMHTPLPPSEHPRYDLNEPSTLAWLQPKQQRKCTLCLEPMKDPSVTTCGHIFCWTCILDWIHEKPECPLCRQNVLGQHVLPLRG